MNKQYLTMTCDVAKTKANNDDSRVLRFVGSTATRDRMGDEIAINGWQTKAYMKNPVFLWAHNYQEPPIGKTIKIERTDKGLMFDVEFASAEIYPKADQIFQLYKHGFLKATSVGFRSLKSEWMLENTEEEESKRKKNPDLRPGKEYKKQELLELSAVPVPANPEALLTARKKGFDVPEDVQRYTDNNVVRDWFGGECSTKDGNYTLQELGETIKELQRDIKELRLSNSESGNNKEMPSDDEDNDNNENNNVDNNDDNKPESESKPKPTVQPGDENANTGDESDAAAEDDESAAQPESENANADRDNEDSDDDDFIEIVDDDEIDDDNDDDDNND